MQEPSSSNSVKVINLNNYTSPSIVESPNRRWVDYGEKNEYFNYLLDRYRGSATNHALINGISQMIVGEGLVSDEAITKPEEFKKANALFTYSDLTKWAFDLKGLGFYMQQIILNTDLKAIAKIKHTPVQNWRSGKANEDGEVEEYWYSDNWEKSSQAKYRPVSYPAYKKGSREPLQILAVKPYRAGSFYYPNVDYQGCLQYSHIEEEISNFHINNLLNGMFPGLLMNFNNGDPGVEIRSQIERDINEKWGGSSNTARIVIAFNDDKERAATVEPIQQTDLDKMFDLLSKESSEKIMIGHRVTSPALFGVKSAMGLGNNADELRVASILFEETVMRPYRFLMLENIHSLLADCGVDIEMKFKSLNPFSKFPTYQETPQKMDIADGTNLSKHEHDHRPMMTEEMQKAYLEAITPYGELGDDEEWFEVDVSAVGDEEEEDKMFKDGDDR